MLGSTSELESEAVPTLRNIVWFAIRAKGLQLKRTLSNLGRPTPRLVVGNKAAYPYIIAQSVARLDTGVDYRERPLLLGKYENLRVACRKLHQRVLDAGTTFSFWRNVGPPWRWHGFVLGREVREGCVIPTIGGGLCQLSGSLLEVARQLGFEVIEHHQHTALPRDISYNKERDATLFWNYVDLRFCSSQRVMLEAFLTTDSLVVRVRAETPTMQCPSSPGQIKTGLTSLPTIPQSCFVCNKTACVRCVPDAGTGSSARPRTAWLLDQFQPEFDRYVQGQHAATDMLFLPYKAGTHGTSWDVAKFDAVKTVTGFRWLRALLLRLAVARGMSVAQAHFTLARLLARRFAARIDPGIERLCVSQSLLPHLWQTGVLGGRCFDVLMYREPIAVIEDKLDKAARRYPEGLSLTEFRAPGATAEAELEALQAARSIITPHAHIAARYPQAQRIDWVINDDDSVRETNNTKDIILFCGPTLARKGAHAVREALRRLKFPLHVLGEDLEGPDFWEGLPVVHVSRENVAWKRVYAVIQPALFEYWPRDLLKAHAAGAQLVISPGCGIKQDEASGIYHVPFGDAPALIHTLSTLLNRKSTV